MKKLVLMSLMFLSISVMAQTGEKIGQGGGNGVHIEELDVATINMLDNVADVDWNALRNNFYLDVQAPEYRLSAGERSFTFPVLDLCVNGELLQTAKPVQVCEREVVDYSQGETGRWPKKCVKYATVTPSLPLSGMTDKCAKTEYRPNSSGYYVPVCTKYVEVRYEIPLTHDVQITHYLAGKNYYNRDAYKGKTWKLQFTFPACE